MRPCEMIYIYCYNHDIILCYVLQDWCYFLEYMAYVKCCIMLVMRLSFMMLHHHILFMVMYMDDMDYWLYSDDYEDDFQSWKLFQVVCLV